MLDRLLQHALAASKRVRTATGISRHAVSVAYAAANLARTIFERLEGRSVLLLGAEQDGRAGGAPPGHAGCLRSRGDETVRTRVRRNLASALSGTAVPWDALPRELARVDIVVTGTARPPSPC
jgi:glutamyl-tRNA reductase